ncbi:hypothetical protein KIPB_013122, partial [Kipferlia bialata]
ACAHLALLTLIVLILTHLADPH